MEFTGILLFFFKARTAWMPAFAGMTNYGTVSPRGRDRVIVLFSGFILGSFLLFSYKMI
jgi:hypothetical protein